MLTAEEKLQHFSQLVFSRAQDQCGEIIEQARAEAKKTLEAYENECLERAYKQIQKQMTTIQKQANESVSKLQIESKKELLIRREAMMNEVFDGVLQKIGEFHTSDAYAAFLEQAIQSACGLLGEGKKIAYVDASDAKHLPSLQKKFPELDFCVLDGDDSIIGGVRVLHQETRQIADNTIAARIEEQKQSFLNTSGLVL